MYIHKICGNAVAIYRNCKLAFRCVVCGRIHESEVVRREIPSS